MIHVEKPKQRLASSPLPTLFSINPSSNRLFHSRLDLLRHLCRCLLRIPCCLHRRFPRLHCKLPPAVVPVVQVPIPLHNLRGKVDGVAAEEEVVCGRDGERVTHEGCRVEGEGGGHAAGDARCVSAGRASWCGSAKRVKIARRVCIGYGGNVHLGILAHVRDGSQRDTKVTCGAPEICLALASPASPFPYRSLHSVLHNMSQ